MTLVKDAPKLDDVLNQWPPKSHIIHKRDQPAREGTIALCGAKLMGIDLGNLKDATGIICDDCVAEFKRLSGL